jgi:hypothetical protein
MGLKQEMLESAGIITSRKSIIHLITEGIYSDKSLHNDLKTAVYEGILTESDAMALRRKATTKNKIYHIFGEQLPALKEEIEERISYLENEIENSNVLTESEHMSEELLNLTSTLEKIKDIID